MTTSMNWPEAFIIVGFFAFFSFLAWLTVRPRR